MDIYNYFNSRDIAAYCREINKVWTPFEMAVIIGRSNRPMLEKHAAWRELITEYPDMPTPENRHNKSFESLHQKLAEVIDYEERLIALFKTPEPNTFYMHELWRKGEYRRSHSVFTSFEKAWADSFIQYDRSEAQKINMTKINVDDQGEIEVQLDYDSNICSLHIAHNYGGWFPDADWQERINFEGDFYIDIPIPFKRGDILKLVEGNNDDIFVFDHSDRDDSKHFEMHKSSGDGFDMVGWGFCLNDAGVYGFIYEMNGYDSYEYHRGKLEGKERLLHYVSLYLKDEIHLTDLMMMQCRIILEDFLAYSTDPISWKIPKHLLVENRLTPEQKEEVKQGKALMPLVADKLSIHHIEFLAKETGSDRESVQIQLSDDGGRLMGRCAGIVHDENHYEKTNDSRFNYARRAMARVILSVWQGRRWVD